MKKIKVITRDILRGSNLIPSLCPRAKTVRYNLDNIQVITCEGAMDEMTDERWEDCKTCGALDSEIDFEKIKETFKDETDRTRNKVFANYD